MPLLKINTVNIYCRGFHIFSRYTYFNVLLTLFCNMEILCPTFLLLICGTVIYCLDSDSVGEESTYNAGDWGSIPELGRSPGEGNGNPLQYSCLGNPMDRGAWPAVVHGVARIRHDLATKPPDTK